MSTNATVISLIGSALLLIAPALADETAAEPRKPNAEDVALIERRMERLRNVDVTFSYTETLASRTSAEDLKNTQFVSGQDVSGREPARKEPPSFGLEPINGVRSFDCHWYSRDDRVRYERIASAETKRRRPIDALRIESIYEGRHDRLAYSGGRDNVELVGSIADAGPYPEAHVDLILGLKLENAPRLLTAEGLRALEPISSDADSIVLARKNKRTTDVLQFSRKWMGALTRYSVTRAGETKYEWVPTDFAQVARGVWVPQQAALIFQVSERGEVHERRQVELTIDDVKLKERTDDLARFPITFPNGIVVAESRIDENLLIQSGDQTIDDEKLRQKFGRPLPRGAEVQVAPAKK